MSDELFNEASQHVGKFSEAVNDQFGHSIVVEVFQPLLQDISGLQQMGESLQARVLEIDLLIGELQAIGVTNE